MHEVFNDYGSREELLNALETQITQTTNAAGEPVFRLQTADAYRERVQAAQRTVAEETKKRQELETKLQTLVQERDELEKLRAEAANPSELRAALQRNADQASSSRAKAAALEAELKPLREENAAYKERETRAAIEAQLVDAAKRLNCCEPALRDVKRLAPIFQLNAAGVAQTQDNRGVADVLEEELAQSPHWLNRSQGAAASSGSLGVGAYGDRERFQQALEGTSFADVLSCAPRQKVERLY